MIAAALLTAALPVNWQAWKWSAPIAVPKRAGIVTLTLPPAIAGKARGDLGDLRVIDSAGNEVPYAIVVHRGSTSIAWHEAHLDDYGFVAARGTQVVAGVAPADATDFTTLEISTPKTGFATTAAVYASNDRQTWRLVRNSAPLYDYQNEGLGSNLRVKISPQHAHWYRIEIEDTSTPFPIDGVRLATGNASPPELQRFSAGPSAVVQKAVRTIVTIDSRIAHLPVSFARFDSVSPRFSRTATLEYSNDGVNWNLAAQTRLSRTAQADHRTLTIDETQARFWRLIVRNENDRPLVRPAIELWGAPRHLVFRSVPGGRYRLVIGNEAAFPAAYDFAATNGAGAIAAAARVRLGELQANSAYSAPRVPWSETHAWVLWAALGVAIAGIGGFALRILLTGSPSASA